MARGVRKTTKKEIPLSSKSDEKGNPKVVVRLLRPWGFIEQEHGKGVFHWQEGEVVTNPLTIALLEKMKAPIMVYDLVSEAEEN